MTKSRFNLRNVAKIGVTCLAVCMMFSGCGDKDKDKDDDKGGGNAAGQVEFQGKKYPLNECQVTISDKDDQSEYLLGLKSKNGNTTCVFAFSAAKGNELPTGTFTTFIYSPAMYVDDDVMIFASDERKLEIKKSGSDYDITYTGKVTILGEGSQKHDFKMTWKGKVETLKL